MDIEWDEETKKEKKISHSLFIDDLKIYQESHQNLEVVNEMIVNASMDIAASYGVKKCAEIVFRKSKMIKGEGLVFWKKKRICETQTKMRSTNFFDANRQIKMSHGKSKERNHKQAGPSNGTELE